MLKRAVCLAVAAGALCARANATDELHTPYTLRIVLHVAEHKLLGTVFRDRISRELHDGLQTALGELAQVSVVDKHPRLAEILKRGLERGFEGWSERDGVKTHFVLIDFTGNEYEIQARQHDGLTGRPGRVVRRDRTRDRDLVPRAAALMVAQDFGLVGSVRTAPDAQRQVDVELHAGALGSLTRWLRKGQVFEIVPPGGTAPLDWALLQVLDPPADSARDGLVRCRLHHRYELGNIVGDRCLLLGTTRGPLRLRFVQEKTRGVQTPLDRVLTLVVRRSGFSGEDTTLLATSTDVKGWVETTREGDKGVFEDVAFVSVTGGMPKPLPNVPVAILDDRPVIVPVNVADQATVQFAARRANWERKVDDSWMVQVSLFQEIQDLAAKKDTREQAKRRAMDGIDRTRRDYQSLMSERDALAAEARHIGGFNPAREDRRLKELQEGEKILRRFVEDQEGIDRDESDPKKKEWRSQIEQARRWEQEFFEVGRAIAIYERVIKEGGGTKELQEHLEELKKQWEPKDDKHRDAKGFIYNVWPKLDAAGLKKWLAEAHKAFAECQRVKDVLSVRKLFKATEEHAVRLKTQLENLQPKVNIDDEPQWRLISEVSEGLTKLAGEIVVYLQKEAPIGQP
jgi:hypothetical protein